MTDVSLRVLMSEVGSQSIIGAAFGLASAFGSSGLAGSLSSAFGNLTQGMLNIQNSTAGFNTVQVGMADLQHATVDFGNAIWQVAGITAMVGTVAAVAIGTQAVKAAGDYQKAMDMVQALTGASSDQMKSY